MSGEYHVEFRAVCTVVPPDEYPRRCPFISDGYRPNIFFGELSADGSTPIYCIGQLSLTKERLYPGERDEVTIRGIVDDFARTRLVRGTAFEIREAKDVVACCEVSEVLFLDAESFDP